MRVSLWKSLGLSTCIALTLAASAQAEKDALSDDVARRTERELFKMSQVDAGTKKVRVVTPARPVAAQAPLVEPPQEIPEDGTAAPFSTTEGDDDRYEMLQHDPTLLTDTSCNDCGECCGNRSCGPCCCCLCGPPGNCWVRAEVLGWWTEGQNVPPLVTRGVDNANPGIIGEPGTEILFGGGDLNEKSRIGGRISAGRWLDECHTWGIEGDYFALDDSDQNFFASGFDNPFLSRPFIDVQNGLPGDPAVEAVNNDDLCGEILAKTKSGFQGAGFDVRRNLHCCTHCPNPGGRNPRNWGDWSNTCCKLDLIGGYRFYRLDDSVYVNERLDVVAQGGSIAFGTRFDITDDFRTRNEFHGGEIGLVGEFYRGRWFMEALVKVALGNNHQKVRIDGRTITTVPGQQPNELPGGLLALPSNIGVYTRDDFAVVPQLAARLGYQFNCHLRGFVGYDFLYWANVARAGDQIDLRVDIAQLPPGQPGQFPEFRFRDESFWAQGISGGVEFRW